MKFIIKYRMIKICFDEINNNNKIFYVFIINKLSKKI